MYTKNLKGWAKHIDFIILDIVYVIVAFFLSYFLRFGLKNPFENEIYIDLFLAFIIIDFLVIVFLNSMNGILKRGYYQEFMALFWQDVAVILVVNTYLYSIKAGHAYSRILVFATVLIHFILVYAARLVWKAHVKKWNIRVESNALLIIASQKSIPSLIEEVRTNNYGRHTIVGVVTNNRDIVGEKIDDVPVVASFDDVIPYVTKNWVDEVLVSFDPGMALPDDMIDDLNLMGVTVHVNLDKSGRRVGVKQVVTNIGGLLVISSATNFMTPRQAFLKRTMDIIGGLVGCLLTGLLCIVVGPMIYFASPGPIFFAQKRVGRNGKIFKFYKFRSMYMDAEERKKELMAQNRVKDGMMFKIEFDPRIIGNRIDENGNRHTGIGEFIRRYSIDEFPQFFNVLKGDMSLVGTRPPLVSEYEKYQAHHKARLAAKPGLTGLWQVSGRSNIMDFEEVVRLDTQYINNWNVGLDIKIIFKTIMVVLKKEGSM